MTTKLDRLELVVFFKLVPNFVRSCCRDFLFQKIMKLIIVDSSEAYLPTQVTFPLHQVGSDNGIKLFVRYVVFQLECLQKVKVRLVL